MHCICGNPTGICWIRDFCPFWSGLLTRCRPEQIPPPANKPVIGQISVSLVFCTQDDGQTAPEYTSTLLHKLICIKTPIWAQESVLQQGMLEGFNHLPLNINLSTRFNATTTLAGHSHPCFVSSMVYTGEMMLEMWN